MKLVYFTKKKAETDKKTKTGQQTVLTCFHVSNFVKSFHKSNHWLPFVVQCWHSRTMIFCETRDCIAVGPRQKRSLTTIQLTA